MYTVQSIPIIIIVYNYHIKYKLKTFFIHHDGQCSLTNISIVKKRYCVPVVLHFLEIKVKTVFRMICENVPIHLV